ncbi:MAG: 3-phosphoshikimate 1-carboxyvinyltransferase [Christensenellales bacterium]|jgi:3-phosphoshikimate 1-carboxyvinyltransferase
MEITIAHAKLSGTLAVPPSKSYAHRALICAALAKGDSVLHPVAYCDDAAATAHALSAMGLCTIERKGETVFVSGGGQGNAGATIDCNESGSTLRFLLPVSLLFGGNVFSGRGRLMKRPMEPFQQLCAQQGFMMNVVQDEIRLRGMLRDGNYELSGNVSSQFISGMLMALPRCGGSITITTALQSSRYVDMTIEVMRAFGVTVTQTNTGFLIEQQSYQPAKYTVEGDYSSAAFFLVMGALGARVCVKGLRKDSLQPDASLLRILQDMGADVCVGHEGVSVAGEALRAVDVDVSQYPDLLPVLAVAASAVQGKTRFYNALRLRYKESDRIQSTQDMINALGGEAESTQDELTVYGMGGLRGGRVDACGDHRIAMAAATAAVCCTQPVVIQGAECVSKSMPDFFEAYQRLGGDVQAT